MAGVRMEELGVVIVAAGTGSRMRTAESKQYLLIAGKPIIVHTLERFQSIAEVNRIVLVTGPDDLARCRRLTKQYGLSKVSDIIVGGAERQESVYRGLQALRTEWVLVHDGVRPFVRADKVLRCWEAAKQSGAAVLAVPVKDTIKVVDPAGVIQSTPDRRSLWAIQTPQAFRLSLLMKAHEQAVADGFLGTDDASVVERLGEKVHVVEGDYENIKITTPEDLDTADAILHKEMKGRGTE